jgi:predicted AAA+ superfamily ATPase
MNYPRQYDALEKEFFPNRALILYGPRRVGKTFLLNRAKSDLKGRVFYGTGEDLEVRDILQSESVEKIKGSFSGYDWVIIDEAQKVDRIGHGLKIAIDHLPEVRFIATGSSSFELAHQIGEPLTGRKITLTLYPLSTLELKRHQGGAELMQSLDSRLIFGSYPEIMATTDHNRKTVLLKELRDSYLYKDILELENLRNAKKITDLLQLIAWQVGKEVSLHELGTQLGMDKRTVERYLDLLEKAFVIVNVRGFSRNLRKEVTKTSRYYFLDNGILNAVLNNFNPVSMRSDKGALWENFIFMERLKFRSYTATNAAMHFWRTYDRQEIDLVEDSGGNLHGYEFKYSSTRKTKTPVAWAKAYPEAGFDVITRDNWIEFVT